MRGCMRCSSGAKADSLRRISTDTGLCPDIPNTLEREFSVSTHLLNRNSSFACRFIGTLALTFFPLAVLAQTTPGTVDATTANNNDSSTSNAETDKAARSDKQKQDCEKSIDEIAYNNLSPEHKKTLGPQSFVNQLGIVGTFNGVKNAISLFTTGATDNTRALRALDESRAAAIMYKAELCSASARDSGRSEPSGSPTVTEEKSAKDEERLRAAEAAASVETKTPSAGSQKVVGLSDWEGEISGRPVAGSKFESLKIGMSATQVIGTAGRPDDLDFRSPLRSKITSPSPRYRLECAYKGIGRLVFASVAGTPILDELYLVRIVHDPEEPGKI